MERGRWAVHSIARRTRYFVLVRGRDWHQTGGWQGGVGWMDGCMDGSGLRCPAKQIMIAVTWWVCIPLSPLPPVPPPSGVCLRVSVWPLLTLAWSTHRACLLAVLDVPSSLGSRVGECSVVVWMRAVVPVTFPIAPPRPLLHRIPIHPPPR